MPALYFLGPGEPGGDDDIIAEVVDGILRRRIEIADGVAKCTGFDDYPVAVDMAGVADYVWPISEQEFNDVAWLLLIGSAKESGPVCVLFSPLR